MSSSVTIDSAQPGNTSFSATHLPSGVLTQTTRSSITDSTYDPEFFPLYDAAVVIQKYYLWIIFILGFPGNIAAVVTVIKMSRLRTSSFLVGLLACVDNLAIILKILYLEGTRHKVRMTEIGCQCLLFIGFVSVAFANWILIILAAERFVAVRYPLKVSIYWSIKRAVIITIGVAIFLASLHLHAFWTFEDHVEVVCTVKKEHEEGITTVWYWISASIYSFIPCIALIVFNFVIIYTIRKSSQVRKGLLLRSDNATGSEAVNQERQITIMLVLVTVVFIILTVPRCIFIIVTAYFVPEHGSLMHGRVILLDQLTNFLADSNHAVNFYLYFVSSKMFRQSFLNLIMCKHRVTKHSTVTLITDTNNSTPEIAESNL